MASNIATTQPKLNTNGNENPSYQDPANLGKGYSFIQSKCQKFTILSSGTDSYGTFLGDSGGVPPVTTVSAYPYALGSQQPTIIYLGGCPACKVCIKRTFFV